jgi:hypothetical protein
MTAETPVEGQIRYPRCWEVLVSVQGRSHSRGALYRNYRAQIGRVVAIEQVKAIAVAMELVRGGGDSFSRCNVVTGCQRCAPTVSTPTPPPSCIANQYDYTI